MLYETRCEDDARFSFLFGKTTSNTSPLQKSLVHRETKNLNSREILRYEKGNI